MVVVNDVVQADHGVFDRIHQQPAAQRTALRAAILRDSVVDQNQSAGIGGRSRILETGALVIGGVADEEIVGEGAASHGVLAADPAASAGGESRAVRRIVQEEAVADCDVRTPHEIKPAAVLGGRIIDEGAVRDRPGAGVDVNPASILSGVIGKGAMGDFHAGGLDE